MMLLQAPASGSNWMQLVLMGGIFVVMYFFMIRPQQKKAKDQQKFITDMKEGDAVVTIGGLHGKIVETTEKTVTLDVGRGMRLVFDKTAISRDSSIRLGQ
ncbi:MULTISPECIES: preprotein translocase subunit YajC [Siphonobacter]|uniref:Sec translocon accessory complex subunit YajC n=1 Tax=Siphonobacter curvatus TaxID=2094562 RepID=A0A2S7IL11_9BACT|nr:preprotein translocase subunit YajC [Siphonobacter curvatus]PQA58414.1 preprotein translocase subunit YajC [Siphonobacter curvatus]